MPDKIEAVEVAKPATVTNNSSCNLSIGGVLIEKGKTETVPNFDAETKINKAYLGSKMISVKK